MRLPFSPRLRRLEAAYGRRRECPDHETNIVVRMADGDADIPRPTSCARCGRPARLHLIELEVVPDRQREERQVNGAAGAGA